MRRGALISVPSLPVEFIEGGSATLSPGKEYWVTATAKLTLAKSARLGDRLKIVNSTDAAIALAGGGTSISGVDNAAKQYADQSSVRIPAGGEADLVRSRRRWRARGCERPTLSFAYNGTPLAGNSSNPGGAADLIHYLGGVGSFTNPATNGTIAAATNSVANGLGGVSVLSDRVASPSTALLNWQPSDVANSWVAWQFPALFLPTRLLIQTRGDADACHPRSFELRYSNDLSASLSTSSPVGSWTLGQSWTNQQQITGTGAWFDFVVTGLIAVRRLAIRFSGPDSWGLNYPTIAEVGWFGDYFA